MQNFQFVLSWVLKPWVSWFRLGYFVFIILSASSCVNKNHADNEVMIAKTVPLIFINAADTNLVISNDTIHYQNKLFSGYIYSLYMAGDTAELKSFFNGVEEGFQKKWYENRQLSEQRFYINGKKQGRHEGWWPDGKEKFYFTANKGEYDGEFKEWYSSGILGKHFNYLDGHEEGSQRLWWDNGAVRANYVIRNGRKYGLIGLKTCINPYDSIYKN